MLRVLAVSAAALIVAGCSSGGSATSSGSATQPSGASSSAATSAAASALSSASAGASSPSGALTLVSQSLAKEGAQVVLDASSSGTNVVASVLSQTTVDDYDAGLVYSTDAGSTWKWGGVVADAGKTFPEAIATTSKGAVMVGTNEVGSQTSVTSQAFIAIAAAPDYKPVALPIPPEFQGENVHLQDVAVFADVILVIGWEQSKPDASGNAPRTSYLWRSSDGAKTWSRAEVTIPGSKDNSLEQIAFGPDGSWNLIGQAVFGDGANQYDPVWLKSVDAGATFQLTNADVFAAPLDQGATRIEFAGDGAAAILGWDEVKDGNASRASALWVSGPNQILERIGKTEVPVSGGTPPGEFINGLLWDNTNLAAWGSPTGAYPMDNVQFWGLTKDGLTQSTMLPGHGTPLAISRILVGQGEALAFGFTGKDLASADAAIWKGASIQ
jgi:hypothetical protein